VNYYASRAGSDGKCVCVCVCVIKTCVLLCVTVPVWHLLAVCSTGNSAWREIQRPCSLLDSSTTVIQTDTYGLSGKSEMTIPSRNVFNDRSPLDY